MYDDPKLKKLFVQNYANNNHYHQLAYFYSEQLGKPIHRRHVKSPLFSIEDNRDDERKERMPEITSSVSNVTSNTEEQQTNIWEEYASVIKNKLKAI